MAHSPRRQHQEDMPSQGRDFRSVTTLRVAERVSHSTGMATVVSPAPMTISGGRHPQPVGPWTDW